MRIRRGLAALLAALMLLAMLPAALTEPADELPAESAAIVDDIPAEPAAAAADETPADPAPAAAADEIPAEPAAAAADEIPAEPAPAAADEIPADPASDPAAEAPSADEAGAGIAIDENEADWSEELPPADPEVPLATELGDTGLIVEEEDDYDGPAAGYELLPDDAVEDGAVEAPDAVPGDEEGLEVLAVPAIEAGYVAVAAEAPIYADAARTQAIGVFPEGAMVYAEPIEDDAAMLRIRFDTEDSRGWDQDILTGYVLAADVLAYTAEESAALVESLAADARTRSLNGVAIPCVRFTAVNFEVLPSANVVGLGVTARTQAEIQAFANDHPAYRNQLNLYAVAPSNAPYSVGRLSAVNHQSALNLVNQIRYIAGLNADVSLYADQEEAMASTALVLRLYSEQYKAQYGKDILTHYPPRAAALADASYDALYAQGYTGAGRANIAMGYTATGSILAYMSDAADNNVNTVGHRRWLLNPTMGRTVFGANGRFTAMYAHDVSGAGGQVKVAWPAQETPYQYFSPGDPWSLSYGRVLAADKMSVSLVRVRDGRTWSFSAGSADGLFAVDNGAYGQKGCVIFRPSGLDSIAEGDTFNVSVTEGETGEITRYTVRFFALDLTAATPMDALSTTAVKTPSGNVINWNADGRATGYYVCRRVSTASDYQIIADVSGTSYTDTAVFDDLSYYYQVYAHNACVSSRSAVSVEAKPIVPESVALSASGTVTLYKNATLQLSAIIEPSNATTTLTWKTSRARVATVDGNGLVTPLRKGSTIVSVTTDNGKSASVKIKVVNPPKAKKVLLSASGTITLNIGETLQLYGAVEPADADQTLTWKSGRKKVASVNGAGLVTALAAGKATISARASNGKRAKVKIIVVDPLAPASVALSHTGTVTLKPGETLQLGATVAPATAQTTLRWTSSRRRVASVDADGRVTALRVGTAVITVRTANNKKARVKIKVVK